MTATDWDVERGVTCVVCPDCAFTFDAIHLDCDTPTYTCPLCQPDEPHRFLLGWVTASAFFTVINVLEVVFG